MHTGKLYINGNDAYLAYGLILYTESAGLNENNSALLTPPAVKTYTTVAYRERTGEEVSVKSPCYEARSVTLLLAILAEDEAGWWSKFTAFTALLKSGWIELRVTELGKTYRLYYQSFSTYKQLTEIKGSNRICAKFQVKFREPKPNF